MTSLSKLVGTWQLAGAGTLNIGDSDLEDLAEEDMHADDFVDRADSWLAGEGDEEIAYVTAAGRSLTITGNGVCTETQSERGQYEFLDAAGVGMHNSKPFPAQLVDHEGRLIVLHLNDTENNTILRFSDDQTAICEDVAIDEDGDLIRTQHVVHDGRYLSRNSLVYRR